MAPKKKGKGSKLSRMTEEERARYLQHRAAIEEEAKRRKQQLVATFMKVWHFKKPTAPLMWIMHSSDLKISHTHCFM